MLSLQLRKISYKITSKTINFPRLETKIFRSNFVIYLLFISGIQRRERYKYSVQKLCICSAINLIFCYYTRGAIRNEESINSETVHNEVGVGSLYIFFR